MEDKNKPNPSEWVIRESQLWLIAWQRTSSRSKYGWVTAYTYVMAPDHLQAKAKVILYAEERSMGVYSHDMNIRPIGRMKSKYIY